MRIVELIIDEKDETSGIDAVSVVESPAIESDFIYLSKHEIELKEVDAEKRILMGAALIPNKQIYRKNDKNEEYYIYFSEETVRKASELFFMNSNQNNATLEHKQKLDGMSVVESWITEGKNDKSTNYGFNFPKGTWVISMKVNNDEIWNKVKLGEVKGFSIEGYFADKYEMSLNNIEMEDNAMVEKIKELITKSELKTNKVELGSIDVLKTDAIAYNKLFDSYNNDFKTIQSQVKNLSNEFNKVKDLYMSWFGRYNKTEDQANELGIKLPSDIIKLEKDAIDKSNEARDMGNKLAKLL